MSWLEKLLPPKIQPTDPNERRSVPEGLWIKCPSCETVLYKNDLEQNQNVCPTCGHHHRMSARARLNAFLDAEGRYEVGQEVLPVDPLKFKDSRKYPERLKEAMENTGETDALVVMGGSVHSINLVAAAFEFDFMGGSRRDKFEAAEAIPGGPAYSLCQELAAKHRVFIHAGSILENAPSEGDGRIHLAGHSRSRTPFSL